MTSILQFRRDTPGVLAPPPLIFVGFMLAGIGLDYLTGGWEPNNRRLLAGAASCAAAAFLLVPALRLFRKADARAKPWQPTTSIVTTGIYALTRNPMYVSMALAYAGVALLAGSHATLLVLPLAISMIQRGVIQRVEAYLSEKFGPEHLRYNARVRRWL